MMTTNEIADSAEFVPLMAIKDEPTSEGGKLITVSNRKPT